MNDAYWRDVVIGIYQHLKVQMEILRELAIETQTLSEVLNADAGFHAYYKKHRATVEKGPAAAKLEASLTAIDASIAGLMGGGKKSEREN